MGRRWRLILVVVGLGLFAALTYHSVRMNLENRRARPTHYLWWDGIRLDSDPLGRSSLTTVPARPCPENEDSCVEWDPEYIWVTPGGMERFMIFSAFPAFVAGLAVVHALGHLGVSEIATFIVVMPPFIAIWFYAVGWLLDRWELKRRARLAPTSS